LKFPPGANWLGVGAIALVVLVASSLSLVPNFRTRAAGTTSGSQTLGPGGSSASADAAQQAAQAAQQAAAQRAQANRSGLLCAPGRNGGATDTGVAGNQIKLATTLAESGIGASFLGDARYGILAVLNQTNREGGVCGRILSLNPVDDGWDAYRGEVDIRTFISESYFALPVVPSSQGLDAASGAQVLDSAGIPVVGTDGMLYSQYRDPWIWPVATSTISTAHIAASNGYARGSRTFGIVWDRTYKFGQEGEAAFKAAVTRLGGNLKADVGIEAGKQDYGPDVQSFENNCQPCDFTFMLLEPDTAIAWIRSDNSQNHYVFGNKQTSGPQPLFVTSFAQACGQLCNNMWIWTGFKAPYPPFDTEPAVAQYVSAIRSVSSSADVANQFLEGSYVGMELFVKALQQAGPNLTRANLRATLNSLTFDSGLAQAGSWREGNHFANTSMLGFAIQFSQGFNGFQYQQTGWVKDPWVTEDHPSS